MRKQQRTVVITGGLGNLGTKLCRHLLSLNDNDDDVNDNDNHHGEGNAPTKTNFSYKVILVEHPSFIAALNQTDADATSTSSNIITTQLLQNVNVTLLSCNLGNPTASQQQELTKALTGADVVVHFSAVNPYPNATWDDCSQSLDHIYYIFSLAVQCSVRRVIFASSNHVMGGYKDDHKVGPASLYPYTEPRVGTIPSNTNDIGTSGDGKAYAAAKLAGERYARTLGNLYGNVTTFVVLRVGWCQPGENIPATLSAAGSPPEYLLQEKKKIYDDNDHESDDNGCCRKQGGAARGMWNNLRLIAIATILLLLMMLRQPTRMNYGINKCGYPIVTFLHTLLQQWM
jgi:nucleoside-diphosphate-sugar epimerase